MYQFCNILKLENYKSSHGRLETSMLMHVYAYIHTHMHITLFYNVFIDIREEG